MSYRSESPKLEPFPIPEEELLSRFEKLYTAAVNDILHKDYGRLDRTLPSYLKPLVDGMKVAGIAFTVKGLSSHIGEAENIHEIRASMIDEMQPNTVVVWDTSGDPYENAQFGEMMTAASMMRGCKGAVVDGGARDTDRILETGFKLWTRFRTPSSMMNYHTIYDWEIPVKIGNVEINPGDVVFADRDGVMIVPRDIAYEVLLRAEAVNKTERGWRDIIASGLSAAEVVRRGGQF